MRPGLDDWLTRHWPPALAWGHPRTRSLARRHVRRHGWHEYASDCCLAAVTAWDSWDEGRSRFGTWFAVVCRSVLRDRIKYRDRRPQRLAGWDGPDRRDPAAEADDRDEAEWLTAHGPHPATCRAVLTAGGVGATARHLGVTRQTVGHRLRAVRRWAMAETDVDDTPRADVIVLPPNPRGEPC